MRDLKSFTSRKMREAIQKHLRESRREWLSWMFERAGQKNGNNQNWQFWQQDNHPIELYNPLIMQQKLDYLHQNPVEAGFVDEAQAWLYSSARDYQGEKGLLDIILIE